MTTPNTEQPEAKTMGDDYATRAAADPCFDEHQPGCDCVAPTYATASPRPRRGEDGMSGPNWKLGDYAERLEDHPLVKVGEVHQVTQMYRGGYLGFAMPVGGEWNPRRWRKVDRFAAQPDASQPGTEGAARSEPNDPTRAEAVDRLNVLLDQARNGTPVSDPDPWQADELAEIIALLAAPPSTEEGGGLREAMEAILKVTGMTPQDVIMKQRGIAYRALEALARDGGK